MPEHALADSPELAEIIRHSAKPTDINDHLPALFTEALAVKPELIVELGVRSGESTFVLERVAGLYGAQLVSVDVCDCASVSTYKHWTFVRQDDIEFAHEFSAWCQNRGIRPRIDVLFIDTSHLYDHTVKEIAAYFPFLSPTAKVFFHDTNLKYINFRRNGSFCFGGWNNRRGVIRAIEDFLGTPLTEKKDFVAMHKGWVIKHVACCNGFTILQKHIT